MSDPMGFPFDDGGRRPSWPADVRTELLRRRIILLRGDLDDQLAGQVAGELMMLDHGDEPVVLHVDSAGGALHAAFAVIDTVDSLRVPVETVCVGRAEGSAAAVVAAAPRRRAAPHARFYLTEPRTSVSGSAAEVEAWSTQHAVELARLVERLAQATGRPGEHVEADLAMGRWLTAPQAVAYGLVDGLWGRSPGS